MINFTIAGYGNKQEATKTVNFIRKNFILFLSKNNANIYNINNMCKLEAFPDLLKKKNTLLFPKSHCNTKEYWGIIGETRYDYFYSRWFIEPACTASVLPQVPYYSKGNFAKLVNHVLSESLQNHESPPCDFSINYEYNNLDTDDACFIIKWNFNDELCNLHSKYIYALFNNIIEGLDAANHGLNLTSYISRNNDYPLPQHQRFDRSYLKTKLLGVSHTFYVSDELYKYYFFDLNHSEYSLKRLKNGCLLSHNSAPENIDIEQLRAAYSLFSESIIPSYKVYSWSHLCVTEDTFGIKPDTISVYIDECSPSDPIIVLSNLYELKEIDSLPEIENMSCRERYILKNR